MKYRGRIEVVADMLSVAQERAKKTHIMYRGNLSFKVLNLYLGALTKANLMSFDEVTGCYLITEKGRLFLEVFRKYKRLVNSLEKRNSSVDKERALLERMCLGAEMTDKNHLAGNSGRSGDRAVSVRSHDS
jgi:predicted transcriptional regulator